MTRKDLHKRFPKDQSGAVATTYALALTGLIVIMGVGFDYGRVMSMDSELQNGADQAALAGATQLDKSTGACSRASAAIVGLLANRSILTSGSKAVTVPSEPTCDATGAIRFWQDKAKTTAATSDANANFVQVFVDVKTVDYAFLPITGLFTSANMRGIAMAGLGSAICKLPPVMMCNPNETGDPNFTIANYVGKGIRLIANDGGCSTQDSGGVDGQKCTGNNTNDYAPGNFGYLETGAGNGAIATARTLGREGIPGDCVATDGVTTKPGEQVSVLDALNVRMGVYSNGLNNVCSGGNGNNYNLCPPSANSRIDLAKGNTCTSYDVGPNPYRPAYDAANMTITPLTQAQLDALAPMGYPRDKCHAVSDVGVCGGAATHSPIGDGVWDSAAYFYSHRGNNYLTENGTIPSVTWANYGPSPSPASGVTVPTRYQLYKYEASQAASRLKTSSVVKPNPGGGGNSTVDLQGAPLCGPSPIPVPPVGTGPDRRVLTVAVINCDAENVKGKTEGVEVTNWIDVFLVEPSFTRGNGTAKRTDKSDVYVEVIRQSTLGGDATQGQEIRKDVPYLIE